jgi:hypothetical protein
MQRRPTVCRRRWVRPNKRTGDASPEGPADRLVEGHEYPRGANLGPSYREREKTVALLWRALHPSHGRKGEAMGKSILGANSCRRSIDARLTPARFHNCGFVIW